MTLVLTQRVVLWTLRIEPRKPRYESATRYPFTIAQMEGLMVSVPAEYKFGQVLPLPIKLFVHGYASIS